MSFVASILIVLLAASVVQVKSNVLIDKQCGVTEAPSKCSKCANNKGASTTVDVIAAMLQCADDDAHTLFPVVRTIIYDGNASGSLKAAAGICQTSLVSVFDHGKQARLQSSQGTLKTAADSTSSALLDLQNCQSAFEAGSIPIPPPISSGLSNVEFDFYLAGQLLRYVIIHKI
ncbi:hypothetical protein RND81_12G209600 [Saponaria officinalis]|uniref:Pectinesterase inhibitor domain-containing protein n=1 Tax=Saponaria officinalis TaxID=3572 RepID=A0AAW1HDC9_SAPOF